MPTAIHESIQPCFTRAIIKAEIDLPDDAQCICVYNQHMNKFEGQYFGSDKTADLAVQITDTDGELETKLVVEMGFSEKHEDLIQDIRLWLKGMNSVLVCVRYQCPIDKDMKDEEFKELRFPDP